MSEEGQEKQSGNNKAKSIPPPKKTIPVPAPPVVVKKHLEGAPEKRTITVPKQSSSIGESKDKK